jgi:hypothetical protein
VSTSITNLVPLPALRSYTLGTKWSTVTTYYSIAQVTDATCPEGGTNVAAVTTNTTGYAVGNIHCGFYPAIRFPVDSTKTVSASAWLKRVNPESHPSYRLLLIVRRAGAVAGTTTTLVATISPPVGVWTKISVENKAVTDPLTIDGYLGVYPIGTLGAIGGITYYNAAMFLQRPVLPPAGRFFDGDTKTWEPDTVCTWTGTPGASTSTWTSVRNQIGTLTRWSGSAEVALTKSGRWTGSAELTETYVESQVV